MAIKPIYKLFADNENITRVIFNRLLGLSITDNAGWESDTLEITLDDTDHAISLPDTGAKLVVYLGYKESELALMGTYIVDEIEIASPPNTMKITAKAADMASSLKSPRTITWEEKVDKNTTGKTKSKEVKLKTIFNRVAKENNLKLNIDKKYQDKKFPILNQRNESNFNFLTRLAASVGGVLKITDDTLILKPRISATGIIDLIPQDISQWRVNITKRTSYDSISASYYDKKSAKKVKVTVNKNNKQGKRTNQEKDKTTVTIQRKFKNPDFIWQI